MAGFQGFGFLYVSAGSSELGCWVYFQGNCFFLFWPRHWENQDILRNIAFFLDDSSVIAVEVWEHMLFNKKVLFHIDNEALVSVINKQTSEDKRIMELVRRFVLNLMLNNVVFKIKHISIMNNNIADSISHKQ